VILHALCTCGVPLHAAVAPHLQLAVYEYVQHQKVHTCGLHSVSYIPLGGVNHGLEHTPVLELDLPVCLSVLGQWLLARPPKWFQHCSVGAFAA
jgi:hypothetical protein